jgi:ubiquinone/menaquinone biosynthesis C-methylase UbiE
MAYWKQKRRIMKRYDRSAHVYDAQYSEEQQAKIKTALTGVHFRETDVIIDIGCGTGQLLPYVSNLSTLVVCVDVSRNLIAQAQARAKHNRHVALLRADADHMPFRPHKFDMAFAITLLQNMPSPTQTLSEMKLITKKDGYLIITGLKKTFNRQQFAQLLRTAGLEISSLKMDKAQREYIAVCTNVKESLNRTRKAL